MTNSFMRLLPIIAFCAARPLEFPPDCKVFDDCPARTHCYPIEKLPSPYDDIENVVNANVTKFSKGGKETGMRCACNHFLAHKGDIPDISSEMVDACHETLGYNTVLTVGIVVVMVCQVLVVRRGLKVSYFLRKANALKFNASGQTLFGAIVAPFFGFFVSLSYFLVLIDVDDSEYSIFDSMRPICFALMAFFLIWATATLSFMWLDILAKSKMDATAKKWIPFIRKFHNGSILVTALVNAGGITLGRSDLAGAFDVTLCLYYTLAYKLGGKNLSIQLMPKDLSQQGSENAKQNAAKIKTVSNQHAATNSTFILGMGLYIVTASNYSDEVGTPITFLGVTIFLFGIMGMCHVSVDYVKFGSRKKLAAAGYTSTLSNIASTVTPSSTTSSSSDDGGGD